MPSKLNLKAILATISREYQSIVWAIWGLWCTIVMHTNININAQMHDGDKCQHTDPLQKPGR